MTLRANILLGFGSVLALVVPAASGSAGNHG
jgi:hypothetical protein